MGYAKDLAKRISRNAGLREITPDELKRLQNVLLQCYLDVQAVCEKHGLNIMLGGGSCLGAVRHQGFIPWDDDMDMLMPREDYEQFTELFEAELGDRYVLEAPNYSRNAIERFPCVVLDDTKLTKADGQEEKIKIDIFLLENVPKNRVLRTIRGLYCHTLMLIASSVQMYESARDSIFQKTKEGRRFYRRRLFIGRLFSHKTSSEWFNRVDTACNDKKDSLLFGIPTGRKHYFGEIFPKEVFLPMGKGLFDGHTVNLPADCDTYLKNLYGDYMTLPPEEKRERHYVTRIDFGEH